jgi:hypothetical protein
MVIFSILKMEIKAFFRIKEIMRIIDAEFTDAATAGVKESLSKLIEQATTLDEIFEEWFIKQGHRFGISMALDDDDRVIPDTFSLFFETNEGVELLSARLSRSELLHAYPQVAPFNIFVKKWGDLYSGLEMDDGKYKKWLKRLGFTTSYALMAHMGSRSGALQLMASFALSGKGICELRHIDPTEPFYEDYEYELEEEGVDIGEYFCLHAAYQKNPSDRGTMQTVFDPFYCKKAA